MSKYRTASCFRQGITAHTCFLQLGYMQPELYEECPQDIKFIGRGCGLYDMSVAERSWVALAVQVFKAYDMSGKFLAGPVSVIDFFGSQLGGRFTNAACAPPIMLSHSMLIEYTIAAVEMLRANTISSQALWRSMPSMGALDQSLPACGQNSQQECLSKPQEAQVACSP